MKKDTIKGFLIIVIFVVFVLGTLAINLYYNRGIALFSADSIIFLAICIFLFIVFGICAYFIRKGKY